MACLIVPWFVNTGLHYMILFSVFGRSLLYKVSNETMQTSNKRSTLIKFMVGSG